MQSMLYGLLIADNKVKQTPKTPPELFNKEHRPVAPALLFIQKTNKKAYSPIVVIDKQEVIDVAKYRDEFMSELKAVLERLYDKEQPFMPTDDLEICASCPFKFMCGR